MPAELFPMVLYIHYAGLAIFGIGFLAVFLAKEEKWRQRAAYLIAGTGFLMAWGGGHISSAEFLERELFSAVNVIGFIILAVLMNLAHRRAVHGPEGKKREEELRAPQKGLTLKRFGYLEGASLIVLMGVAMPLKYLAEIDEAVRYTGMAHGVFFLIFVGWVFWAALKGKWPLEKTLGALVASVIPFGPFVADLAE